MKYWQNVNTPMLGQYFMQLLKVLAQYRFFYYEHVLSLQNSLYRQLNSTKKERLLACTGCSINVTTNPEGY